MPGNDKFDEKVHTSKYRVLLNLTSLIMSRIANGLSWSQTLWQNLHTQAMGIDK